jgi:hypothetical protein
LSVYKSSSTVVDVQGSQGSLLRVTDILSGSLFSVGDISGLPILEVFSDDTVIAGGYNQYDLIVTESRVGIGTSSPTDKLTVSGSVNSITQRLTASLYRSESVNLTTIGATSGSNLYEAGFIRMDLGSITGLTTPNESREFNLFNVSSNVSYFKNTNFVELKSGSYISRITFNYGGIPFINRVKGITGLSTIESEEFTFISYVASGSSTNDLTDATANLLPGNNTTIIYSSTTGLVKLKFTFPTTFFNNYTCSYYSHYEIFKT